MATDKITPQEIEQIGRDLFGPLWPGRMAAAFSVHRQTVYNWRGEGARRSDFCGKLAAYILRQREALARAERLLY